MQGFGIDHSEWKKRCDLNARGRGLVGRGASTGVSSACILPPMLPLDDEGLRLGNGGCTSLLPIAAF